MTDLLSQLQAGLGSTFRLERELGGGGMSRVFLAEEQALHRRVVIKVLSPELAAGVSGERFQREIQLAASLQHPNIVPVLTAGVAAGLPFYSMPFVEGRSLRERLTADGALPIDEVIAVTREVARALAHAHERGIVHRDIKPDNILLAGDATVVTDFGIAKAIASARTAGDSANATLTQVGTSIGTPAYMSPEQAAGDSATDHRTDFYALGCVAYEMLTGRPPFHGQSPARTFAAHMTDTPTPITALRADCPAELAGLVLRCLEKDPGRRPQNARELIAGLPPSGTYASASAPRKRSLLIGVGIAMFTALLVFTIVRRPSPSSTQTVSIAVLPFAHPASDTTQEYLSDGIADGIRSELTRIPGIRVAASFSASSFKGRVPTPSEVGKALDVDQYVTGRMRRLGDNLSISAELVSVSDGSSLWQQTMQRQTRDILSLQDTIVSAVVSALRSRLGRNAAAQVRRHVPDADAYDMFLRARYLAAQSSRRSIDRAIELYEQAVRKDPEFAAAYAQMAWAWITLADAFVAPVEILDRARDAATRARALDPTLPEAFSVSGLIALQYEYDADRGRALFDTALALNPSDLFAHIGMLLYAFVKGSGGANMLRKVQEAVRLDPLNPFLHHLAGMFLAYSDQREAAMQYALRAQELAPGFVYIEPVDEVVFRLRGQYDSALVAAERAIPALGYPPPGMIATLVAMGRRADAEKAMRRLEAAAKERYVAPEMLARGYASLGQIDRAFQELDRGVQLRSALTQEMPRLPELNILRNDPRWERYLRAIGQTP